MQVKTLPKSLHKLTRKLHQRKYRQEFRKYLAEGERLIHQLIQNRTESIDFIIYKESYKNSIPFNNCYSLTDSEFELIADTEQSQGILAVVSMPEIVDFESILKTSQLIVALDAVQDPGNVGTIIRSAVWFGADAILLGIGTADVYNTKTIRSCMSAINEIPLISGDLLPLLDQSELYEFETCLFVLNPESTPLPEFNFSKKTILVFGNEGNGIDEKLFTPKRKPIFIPDYSQGKTESLNVSMAATTAFYAYRNPKNV